MILIPDYEALIVLCTHILQQLSQQDHELELSDEQLPGLARRIASILSNNLASGRFSYVCDQYLSGTDDERWLTYATKVCRVYVQEGDFVLSLQAGDGEAWQRVLERLVKLAYNKCSGSGAHEWTLWEAHDLASKTASELWRHLQSHPYWFDVPFDQWSACILNHRFIDWYRVQKRQAHRYPCSLDERLNPDEKSDSTWADILLEDKTMTQWLEDHANREWLLQAIERLRNPLQRQAIRLRYLEERWISEISREMGITANHVSVLQHRALKRLRTILKKDERFRS